MARERAGGDGCEGGGGPFEQIVLGEVHMVAARVRMRVRCALRLCSNVKVRNVRACWCRKVGDCAMKGGKCAH
jgi:hypothetical protein